MLSKLLALGGLACAVASSPFPDEPAGAAARDAVAADDECLAEDEQCALNALQRLRSVRRGDPDSDPMVDPPDEDGATAGGFDFEKDVTLEDQAAIRAASAGSGWYQGGDKMWGAGVGIEDVNAGNVGYWNAGMTAAKARCGDAGCSLIINPMHHRSVQHSHIHFVHYAGYGSSLKKRAEDMTCGKPGWHGGGLPCGGKAAFFPGWPGVFTEAMKTGPLDHASVIAWPASCGGSGTIIEMAYHCSIEHQIRGDFNPSKR